MPKKLSRWYYFIGWRPVATVPICNVIVGKTPKYNTERAAYLRSFIAQYPSPHGKYLGDLEWAARLDGIFIVRFRFKKLHTTSFLKTYQPSFGKKRKWVKSVVCSLGRIIGEAIRHELSYIGDFHVSAPLFPSRSVKSFRPSKATTMYGSGLATKAGEIAKKKHKSQLEFFVNKLNYYLWISAYHLTDVFTIVLKEVEKYLGPGSYFRGLLTENPYSRNFLGLEPVRICDPYKQSYNELAHCGGAVPSLSDLTMDDTIVTGLRAMPPKGGRSNRLACLRLREMCARKRELCVRAMLLIVNRFSYKYFNWIFGTFCFVIYTIVGIVNFSLYGTLYSLREFVVLSLTFLMLYGLYDIGRRRRPILRVVRHTIGFFEYADVYSNILEQLYRHTPMIIAPPVETGGFASTSRAFNVRYEGERLKLQTKRDLIVLLFASLATITAALSIPIS